MLWTCPVQKLNWYGRGRYLFLVEKTERSNCSADEDSLLFSLSTVFQPGEKKNMKHGKNFFFPLVLLHSDL